MSKSMSEPQTLVQCLARWAKERPHAVALREKRLGIWEEISWAKYHQAVSAVGQGLLALGIGPGDHVAILSDNCPQWIYADLGAQGIGARGVGIYQTNPPEDVAYVLNHCGAKVLFCEDQEQVDKAIAVAEQTPLVEKIIVFDPRGCRHYDDPRLLHWADFYDQALAALIQDPHPFEKAMAEVDPKAGSMVVYTSGTTGQPKGALISNLNAMHLAKEAAALFEANSDDTLLSYLPLCHVAEKIFTLFIPLHAGAVVHFGESIETVRDDLKEVSPTVFLGVPRIWEKMHAQVVLKMKDASPLKRIVFEHFSKWGSAHQAALRKGKRPALLSRLWWQVGDLLVFRPLKERLGMRRCTRPVTGAAPISPDLLAFFHGVGILVLEGYGQTECAGVSHANRPGQAVLGSVGQGLPGMECKIDDDGEILVRGDAVFVGYLHDESATQAAIDDNGWLHTGDIGEVDEWGYLRITGRKKEIIITAGGKNLSPERIENTLKISGYIKEAVAIGDQRKFVAALIQIESDSVGDWAQRKGIPYTSFEDLVKKPEVRKLIATEIDQANQRLAQVEQIRKFDFFPKELHQDDGELTPTQKVRRRTIHERYEVLIESLYSNAGAGA
jgi:long-chain acyl-CoA synthetase